MNVELVAAIISEGGKIITEWLRIRPMKKNSTELVNITAARREIPPGEPPRTPPDKDILSPPANISLPTEAETTVELKKRLVKEIAKAEIDFTNKLKINGKACSCLEGKHNLIIEGAAEELMPKEPNNPVYDEIITWFQTNEPKMTVAASASGRYDSEYIKMAGELGSFRRRLTQEIAAATPANKPAKCDTCDAAKAELTRRIQALSPEQKNALATRLAEKLEENNG